MSLLLRIGIAASLLISASASISAEPGAGTVTDADPALWVMKDEDTTIYLFGTIHILKPGLSWFDEDVKAAFDRSEELIVEIKSDDKAQMGAAVAALVSGSKGSTLPELMSKTDYAAYQAAAGKYGIPGTALDLLPPWMAAVTLSVIPLIKEGYDLNSGVETVLESAAVKAGKDRTAFETIGEQLGFFNSLPVETQVQFLNATIAELDKVGPSVGSMVGAWSSGKPDELATIMNSSASMSPKLHKALLTDRNANWVEKLDARMDQPGTVFVAVGAGHLAGQGSVQELLTARGFKVERVQY